MAKLYARWQDVPAADWHWPDFRPDEIACHGDGSLLLDAPAMDRLQALRTRLQLPLRLNSAYRSPAYNATLAGASPHSRHTQGRAFDIALTGVRRETLKAAAKAVGFTGFGDYDGFVHLDTGPARAWDRRSGRD